MKKLYVGGLPYSMTDNELSETFSKFGQVASASVITDRMSGRSKGFGFVEMSTEDEAKAAIQNLNGSDIGGRRITVDEARAKEERPQNDFRKRF